MDFKEVENLLFEYGNISSRMKKLRDELQNELQSKHDILNLLRANVITDQPRSLGQSDPVYQAVSKVVDIFVERIEKLRQEIDCLNQKRYFVEELLSRLTEEEKGIIELRYFKGCDWRVVGIEKGYSINQCLNIRNSAIKKIAG